MSKILSSKYCFIYLIIFSSVLFFSSIPFRHLLKPDEPRVAGVAAEMARTKDYIVPKLNGELFLEQPPLYTWVSAGIMSVLGKSPFTARFFPALSGFLGVLLIYLLARRMEFDEMTSFFAGVSLATSAEYWIIGNRCLTDMPLCFFIIVAMFSFYNLHTMYKLGKSRMMFVLWFPLLTASFAAALLTKSLIGLAIPTCGLFFWLILECYFNRGFYPESWIALILGAFLSLIPVAIWVLKLYSVYGYGQVYTVVWYNNFGRFSGIHPDHAEPFYYYAEYIFTHLMPWTIFFVTAVYYCMKKKGVFRDDFNLRFILCWLVFPFVMLCVAKGKRPVYLLPLIPAGAFFASVYSLKFVESIKKLRCNRNKIIGWVSIIFLVGYVTASVIITVKGNKNSSYDRLFKYCQKTINADSNLYLYKPSEAVRGCVEFYLGRTVKVLKNVDSVRRVLGNRNGYIIAPEGVELRPSWIQRKFEVKGDSWCVLHIGGKEKNGNE